MPPFLTFGFHASMSRHPKPAPFAPPRQDDASPPAHARSEALGSPTDFTSLFDALADEQVARDADLPDTGIGRERERRLSSAFIRGADYGTRASTVVAVGHAGGGVIVERRFGPHGRFLGQTMLRFADAPLS